MPRRVILLGTNFKIRLFSCTRCSELSFLGIQDKTREYNTCTEEMEYNFKPKAGTKQSSNVLQPEIQGCFKVVRKKIIQNSSAITIETI